MFIFILFITYIIASVSFVKMTSENSANSINDYSDNDSYSDSDDDSSFDEIDEIYAEDYPELKNKMDTKYYIGFAGYNRWRLILSNAITAKSFFKYSYESVIRYLYEYSIFRISNPNVDVLQLFIVNNTFTVVKKTYWIRLIQRHWKKTYRERMNHYLKRGHPNAQRVFSMTGRYPEHLYPLPSIHGMLLAYDSRK